MLDAYERLGLAPGAETREIRKAYARELKKIDQENDSAGFQALREAYEMALHSVGRDTQPAPEPSAAAATQAAPIGDPPDQQAYAAWAECQSLVEQSSTIDEQVWTQALQRMTASDLLVNLDARLWFEAIIVTVLSQGWRPGHESLFAAAVEVFQWEGSPHRLMQFRQGGALLSRALTEKHLLSGLEPQERASIRAAIGRIRDPRPPTAFDLEQYGYPLSRLHQLFPALASITVDANAFHHWREARTAQPIISGPTETSSSPSVTRVLIWLLMIGLVIAAAMPLFKPMYGGRSENVAAPDIPVTKERLWEIGSRVAYQSKPGQKNVIFVDYEVFLDADRTFLGMNTKHRSCDKDFDEAVARAIRETRAFPLDTVSVYRARFSLAPPGAKRSTGDARLANDLPSGTIMLPVERSRSD
ncbi:hypothetical protein GTP58_15345 [Duganella sp. CY15W]|uniref:J domain-containing protein n=1 Tax=Duganella sp. CY15W TaxID=2692172 RepID=UPI00136953F3|nr:J domain-containing protein [Duganella sp. CY15W]MYM29705.1 hypothetical protein [Duganella sp. CY15W]